MLARAARKCAYSPSDAKVHLHHLLYLSVEEFGHEEKFGWHCCHARWLVAFFSYRSLVVPQRPKRRKRQWKSARMIQ